MHSTPQGAVSNSMRGTQGNLGCCQMLLLIHENSSIGTAIGINCRYLLPFPDALGLNNNNEVTIFADTRILSKITCSSGSMDSGTTSGFFSSQSSTSLLPELLSLGPGDSSLDIFSFDSSF